MLSIGEFAGLTGLSVKALRHYDEKGILVPVEADENSGYRRYGEEQVRDGAVIRVSSPSAVRAWWATASAWSAGLKCTLNVQCRCLCRFGRGQSERCVDDEAACVTAPIARPRSGASLATWTSGMIVTTERAAMIRCRASNCSPNDRA